MLNGQSDIGWLNFGMEMSSVLILVVGLGLLFICNGNMTLWGMEKRRRSSFKGPALYKLCCLIITQPIVYLIILMLFLQTFSCKSIYQTNNQWFLLKNIYINDSMYVRWLVLLCFVLFISFFVGVFVRNRSFLLV